MKKIKHSKVLESKVHIKGDDDLCGTKLKLDKNQFDHEIKLCGVLDQARKRKQPGSCERIV